MIRCSHCGCQTHSGRMFCPECGQRIVPLEEKRAGRAGGNRFPLWIAALAAALAVAAGIALWRGIPARLSPDGLPTPARQDTQATAAPHVDGDDAATKPVAPTAAPLYGGDTVAAETVVPAPTAQTGQADGPQPITRVTTRQELIDLTRWMIDSGVDEARLSAMTLSDDEIGDVLDACPGYFGHSSWTTSASGASLELEYLAGVRVWNAIQRGTVSQLAPEYREIAEQSRAIVASLIRPGMSDVEKERALHDYIINHCDYLIDDGRNTADALGFFRYGKCQCSGYTDVFRLLGKLAGLEVEITSGTAANDESVDSHGWNVIRLDGLWYALDVTWDDPTGGEPTLRYTYFNLPVRYFGNMRRWDRAFDPQGEYAAELDGHYYYLTRGETVRTEDEAASAVVRQIDASGEAFILDMDRGLDIGSVSRAVANHYHATSTYESLTEDMSFAAYRFIVA